MNEDGNDIYSRSFEVEESAMRDKNTQSVSSMWEVVQEERVIIM